MTVMNLYLKMLVCSLPSLSMTCFKIQFVFCPIHNLVNFCNFYNVVRKFMQTKVTKICIYEHITCLNNLYLIRKRNK